MINRTFVSICILLLCILGFYVVLSQTEDGTTGMFEGASLMPNLAVCLIFIFVAGDLAISFFRKRERINSQAEGIINDTVLGGSHVKAIALVAGSLAIYAVIMLPFGYILSSILLLSGLMYFTGGVRLTPILVIAVCSALTLYFGLRFGFGIHINALPAVFS